MAILVISANLKCSRCKEKLSKILCSLRDKYGIEKTEFEDKEDRVIVRGNFPPEKLRRAILCKAGGKLVRDIAIVEVWPPEPKKPDDKEKKGDKDDKKAAGKDDKKDGKDKKTTAPPPPPPKPECKLVPYQLPYYCPTSQCQTSMWTGSCPLQCHCCPKPEITKTKTCECSRDGCHGGCKTITPPPSGCGGCSGHGDCGGWCYRPINCPPPPPPSGCGGCSGHGDCGGWCRRPINCPPPPPPPPPPPSGCGGCSGHGDCGGWCRRPINCRPPPPPSGCGGCSGHGDCGGWCRRPINCPPPPPPWGGCEQDENACSVM